MKAVRYALRWQTWAYGLFSTLIGGGAASVSAMVIKPDAFNIHGQLADTFKLFIATGIVSAFAYLIKSPLPPLQETSESEASREDAV